MSTKNLSASDEHSAAASRAASNRPLENPAAVRCKVGTEASRNLAHGRSAGTRAAAYAMRKLQPLGAGLGGQANALPVQAKLPAPPAITQLVQRAEGGREAVEEGGQGNQDPELDFLLILGPSPKKDYSQEEIQTLHEYLGRLDKTTHNFNQRVLTLLEKYFADQSGLVWEQRNKHLGGLTARFSALKIVFYDLDLGTEEERKAFRYQADMLAKAIGAIKVPERSPKEKSKVDLDFGGTGFAENNVLPYLKRAVECVGRKADEVHIIGHSASGVDFSREFARGMKTYLSPAVRVIFHGCSVVYYPLDSLLKEFGTEARIFARAELGEAGQPYGFFEVTLPQHEQAIKQEFLKNARVILPRRYIEDWTKTQLKYLKGKERRKPYKLLADVSVTEDVKQVILDVLTTSLTEEAVAASLPRLEQLNSDAHFPWEKSIIERSLSERVKTLSVPELEALKRQAKFRWSRAIIINEINEWNKVTMELERSR